MTGRWFNYAAVEWVVYESDVPADRFCTYVIVASHTDEHGRGSRASQETIAGLARRSVRSVREDLRALMKGGHLLEGDWRLVADIRPDRRPKVYDLPDSFRATRPAKAAGRQSATTGKKRQNDRQKTSKRPATVAYKEISKRIGKAVRADAQPSAASDTPPDNPDVPFAPSTKPSAEAEEMLRQLGLRRRGEIAS
jgi:hypothetical protein